MTENRELDAWIAEHVMGWKWMRCEYRGQSFASERERIRYEFMPPELQKSNSDWKRAAATGDFPKKDPIYPSPTTDRAAAMEVLERCVEYLNKSGIERGYEISLAIVKDGGMFHVSHDAMIESEGAETLPLAICKFARQLFQPKEGK